MNVEDGTPIDWEEIHKAWGVYYTTNKPVTMEDVVEAKESFWDAQGGKELYFDLDSRLELTKPRTHKRLVVVVSKEEYLTFKYHVNWRDRNGVVHTTLWNDNEAEGPDMTIKGWRGR